MNAKCTLHIILDFNYFMFLVMMAGIIEMQKLCVGCLDSVPTEQELCHAPPMDMLWTISLWIMSTVLGQRKLWMTAATILETIAAAGRERGSFAEFRPTPAPTTTTITG